MFLLFLLTLSVSGCSSFNRDWKAAMAEPTSMRGFEGPWQGRWISEETGHEGALRCLITASTNQARHYKARFQAKYKKLVTITYRYTVDLEVEKRDGVFKFHGQEDLGKLAGGVYDYDGQATPTNFFATYKCEMDHGTFQMIRPSR